MALWISLPVLSFISRSVNNNFLPHVNIFIFTHFTDYCVIMHVTFVAIDERKNIMSQQYPPDNSGQPWNNNPQQPSQPWNNNPQQPYQQYPPDNSGQQPWNTNPQQPPYQQYPQQPYYPQQPPMYQQPPKKRAKWPWFVGGGCLVLLLITCGVLVALGKFASTVVTQGNISKIAATVQSAAQASVTPTSISAHHKINEAVSADTIWQITVTKVSTNQGSTLVTPQAGNTLLQVEVTMKNISTQQQTASSLIQYSLHDASGQKYTEDLLTGKVGPEGVVGAGNSLKGTITYEVPQNTKSFILDFTANFTGEQVSWDLTL
jgi:Domain of unknown function (DUF4352)